MKTDVIKEAIEKVQKENRKLFEDVVEYVSSNRNKTGVHPKGVYQEHRWPNFKTHKHGPFPYSQNPLGKNSFGILLPLARLYMFYKFFRRVWKLLRGKN